MAQNEAIKLPKIDSLKRTTRRQRQIINHAYPQPLTLADLVLPIEYQQTTKGDQFILYDSGGTFKSFHNFGTHQNIEMLRNSQIWSADGTFKSEPALFAQVYVIHSLRGRPNFMEDGHLLHCLFVLLPNKTEAVYLRMWRKIHDLCIDSQPTHIIIDFEKAVIIVFNTSGRAQLLNAVFFHLTQSIWCKVQAEGLQANYNNDEELSLKTVIYQNLHL